jgi:hypothetical protein
MAKKMTIAYVILVYALAHLYALMFDMTVQGDLQTALLPFLLMGMYPPFSPILEVFGMTIVFKDVVYPTVGGAVLVALVSMLLVYIVSLIAFKS